VRKGVEKIKVTEEMKRYIPVGGDPEENCLLFDSISDQTRPASRRMLILGRKKWGRDLLKKWRGAALRVGHIDGTFDQVPEPFVQVRSLSIFLTNPLIASNRL
jgi:hypothetical protein